ncbi:hypothetical protein FRB99_003813, partial [Tulasnella sp. 403]
MLLNNLNHQRQVKSDLKRMKNAGTDSSPQWHAAIELQGSRIGRPSVPQTFYGIGRTKIAAKDEAAKQILDLIGYR